MTDPYPINHFAMLRFDWEIVHGREIVAIRGTDERTSDDDDLNWSAIALMMKDGGVLLTVDCDSDQVMVTYNNGMLPDVGVWRDIAILDDLVGRRLGWCWEGRNYLGYLDAFSIGFDGINPDYMFVGMASTLFCRKMQNVSRA